MKAKITLLIIALGSTFMFAQKQEVKLADRFFKDYSYLKASEIYANAVKLGDSSMHVLTRLGDCYYNNSNADKSATWYGKAIKLYESDLEPEYIFKYSQALRSQGNYEEAIVWLEKYRALNPDDNRIAGLDFSNLELYLQLANDDEVYVSVENLPINSKFADFGAYEKDGKLIFSSSRDGKSNIYDWNGEPFLDIYEVALSEKDGKNTFGKVNRLNAKKINSEFHEANVAITNDGKTLYFTRDNVSKRNQLKTDRQGTAHLKIYKASLIDSTWQNIVELPFNDKFHSNGHPALSPDNKTLFFVSDREGGFGDTDIYKVNILEDGSYSIPENLGSTINTDGKEMFPFVAKDSTLYFSSDSNINLGFLDIYKSNILKDATNTKVENLGAPYNSGYDDFGFFIDSDTEIGYFSSNRPGGVGSDDIYGFVGCSQIVKGTARNKETQEPLSLVTVKLMNKDGKVINTVTTDEKGEYTFKIKCHTKYTVLGEKPDFKNDFKDFTSGEKTGGENTLDLYLIPLIKDNQIVINPIFFDFDKWNIRTDAQYELENIVDVLRAHPNMVIKIESHTDSRGSDRYNMKLSDRRAKSTRDYLLSRDIAPERIESAIGYGESQLLNKCSNGVKCTEEEHQLNRRSYFYILKD
ncbi:OmpA family protein [Flavobacteriaceae bacterium LMO-SS05]|jgi:outer membrane protein OmpA-like peptidoglycan-associated protein/tetratricopeptide (TPR) repeat protein